jgi:AMMECR1 domain-containing protein
LSEVPKLKCSVSLLVHFEDADHVYDWTIGVHGIRITFPAELNSSNHQNGRTLSATYLPEVCSDQNWTKEECLHSLYRKAGYKGSVSQTLLKKTKLQRYQSSKCHLTYDQYRQLVSEYHGYDDDDEE